MLRLNKIHVKLDLSKRGDGSVVTSVTKTI